MLAYTDGFVLVSESELELMMSKYFDSVQEEGLKVNAGKIEVMVFGEDEIVCDVAL